jgi:ribosome maturation factor RimP
LKAVSELQGLIRPLIEANGGHLIDVSVSGRDGGKVLEIFVDTEDGITTEKCAELSRLISPRLDETNLLSGKYYLVVSSPGVERPLKFAAQYERNVGRTISVSVSKAGERSNINGELVSATSEQIVVKTEKNELVTIGYAEIIEAYILPRW